MMTLDWVKTNNSNCQGGGGGGGWGGSQVDLKTYKGKVQKKN